MSTDPVAFFREVAAAQSFGYLGYASLPSP